MESIQKKIKDRREMLGLSQYELARRTKKLNQSQISKIETENRKIAVEDMVLIANALEAPLSWFIEQTNKKDI